jgi:hypothetical protein
VAGLLREELGQHGGHAVEHALYVDIHHLVPLGGLERGKRQVRHQAGIEENGVHAVESVLGQLDDGVVLGLLGDVQLLVYGLAAVLLDLIGDALEVVGPARAEHDLGALAGEQLGRGLADARRCAGDDDGFVFDHVVFCLM